VVFDGRLAKLAAFGFSTSHSERQAVVFRPPPGTHSTV